MTWNFAFDSVEAQNPVSRLVNVLPFYSVQNYELFCRVFSFYTAKADIKMFHNLVYKFESMLSGFLTLMTLNVKPQDPDVS